jgi:hypothetical protein
MLVDSVLSATKKVLPTDEFRKLTTQKVAEVAGVGIGSLYEYFYSKESILRLLLEKEIDKNLLELEKRLDALKSQDLGTISDSLTDYFFDYFYSQKKLMHNLLFALPREMTAGVILNSRIQVVERLEKNLVKRLPFLKKESDFRSRLFFVVNTNLEGIHTYFFIEKQGLLLFDQATYKSHLRTVSRSILCENSQRTSPPNHESFGREDRGR